MTPTPTGRTARSRETILRAALDLCAEQSYGSVTMEAIAARARVGKPTLYRWWPSKGVLYLDVMLAEVSERFLVLPDTGDIAADLRTWIRGFLDLFAEPRLRALCVGVVGTAQHDPELKAMIRKAIHDPVRARNQSRIAAAQAAGQLPAMDPDLIEDMLISPLWYRLLISEAPLTQEYADSVVAAVVGVSDPGVRETS
ncbi:TetR/AcrR family transcriptional regulator [Actinopolymorpha pittospori]